MHHFEYRQNELYCEDVPLARIAEQVGTPAYVYSRATLERHFKAFDGAFGGFPHLTCYSVKVNSNIGVIRLFASLGSGADIVSGGELFRAQKAGLPGKRIVFSGVGKTVEELEAALAADILMFNVESAEELDALSGTAARLGKTARVALRVNPDVDPKTHPYISTGLKKNKFGVAHTEAREIYGRAAKLPGLEVVGIDCHIGSQLTEVVPFVDAVGRLRSLMDQLKQDGMNLRYLDIGGGLGIRYDSEDPPEPAAYAAALKNALSGLNVTLILEPGRVLVGNAGVLLIRVLYNKAGESKSFVITNGGMNDLIRPSFYGSYHGIRPVTNTGAAEVTVDVVGPICESGDFLAKDRGIPAVAGGDLLAVMSAGAYGFVMSSNYNSRRRAAEVLVSGGRFDVIRARESLEDLIRGESIPDYLQDGVSQ